MAANPEVQRYLVTLDTPSGEGQIEVPSAIGIEQAERRAKWAAVAQRWGDVDEITVVSSVLIPREEWSK